MRPRWSWQEWWIGGRYDQQRHVIEIGVGPLGLFVTMPLTCDICGERRGHKAYCVRLRYEQRP